MINILSSSKRTRLFNSVTTEEKTKAYNTINSICGKEASLQYVQNKGTIKGKKFSNKNLKRSSFKDTEFLGCDFTEVVGTGVIWHGGIFSECRFDRADFEYADLSHTQILNSSIIGAGFNCAVLRNSIIKNISTNGSSFAHADFSNSTISKCYLGGTFEGCLFENCNIDGTSFKNSNIDFADFSNAKFNEVELSLMAMPYIFGIHLDQLERCNDTVKLQSGEYLGDSKRLIGPDFFHGIKEDFINFFISRCDYFAVANIYLMQKSYDDFLYAFMEGAEQSLVSEDYRTLKFLCKLIRQAENTTKAIGATRLSQIYETITNRVGVSTNPSVQNQYQLHDGQIRTYLLGTKNDNIKIYFRSNTTNALIGQEISCSISKEITSACRNVGIEIKVLSSEISVNSNPRHILKIQIIQVDLQKYIGKDQTPSSSWNSFSKYMATVATLSMLISGIAALNKLFQDDKIPKPSQETKHIILQSNQVINNWIVPDSYILKKNFQTIAKAEDGTVRYYTYEKRTSLDRQVKFY